MIRHSQHPAEVRDNGFRTTSGSSVVISGQKEERIIARIAACTAPGSRDHPPMISVNSDSCRAGSEAKTAPDSAQVEELLSVFQAILEQL